MAKLTVPTGPEQYGGAAFVRASRLSRKLFYGGSVDDSRWRPGDIIDATALLRVLTKIPVLEVRLTEAPAGRRIAEFFGQLKWGIPKNRIAQSVLQLPPRYEDYLRSHRLVRRKLRKAHAQAMICRPLQTVAERKRTLQRLEAVTDVYSDDNWWVALDSSGEPIGAAAVTIDAEWAMLRMLVARVPECGWLLHAQMVQTLCSLGVGHVFTQPLGALLLPSNFQHFQRAQGYHVANLRRPARVEPQAHSDQQAQEDRPAPQDRLPEHRGSKADRARALLQIGRILARAGLDRAADLRFGVDTCGQLRLGELEAPNRGWYVPSPWWQLRRSLRALGAGSEDVLVDYGAGKGRVILAAMSFPFRRIVGVEISPELAAAAEANIRRRNGRRRCGEVEVIVTDAARWALPDDATVIYMFSPFTGPVFATCVRMILDSVDRHPRRVRLVYANPFEHNFLLQTGRFIPVGVARVPDSRRIRVTQDIVTYEVAASPAPFPADGRAQDTSGVGAWAGFRDTSALLSGFESALDTRADDGAPVT